MTIFILHPERCVTRTGRVGPWAALRTLVSATMPLTFRLRLLFGSQVSQLNAHNAGMKSFRSLSYLPSFPYALPNQLVGKRMAALG